MIGAHGGSAHGHGTAATGMRPGKMMQQNHQGSAGNHGASGGPLSIYQSVNGQNQNNAWKAIDMNLTKGQSNSAQTSQASNQQHRNGSGRFGAGQLQVHNNQQFGTIVHPSIIKTNNLMMESIVSGAGSKPDGHQGVAKKISPQTVLNNTTIQPLSSQLPYGSVAVGTK